MNDIKITIKYDTAKDDLEKLRRVLSDLNHYQVTDSSKEDGVQQLNEELKRRLRESGIRVE